MLAFQSILYASTALFVIVKVKVSGMVAGSGVMKASDDVRG